MEEREKMTPMKKKGLSNKGLGSIGKINTSGRRLNLDIIPFRNSQIKNKEAAYERQAKIDEGVEIGENSMFTGNAWFDIGLGLGRRARAKKAAKLTK